MQDKNTIWVTHSLVSQTHIVLYHVMVCLTFPSRLPTYASLCRWLFSEASSHAALFWKRKEKK